jgi:hypothetical protein
MIQYFMSYKKMERYDGKHTSCDQLTL